MLTLLLDTIGTDRRLRVLEIGGGFGNMVRILKSHDLVDNWTIFDLDFMCEAQAHFIKGIFLNFKLIETATTRDLGIST